MKNRFIPLILAVVMLLSLAACGSKDENTPASRRAANEIVLGIGQDLDSSLDPHATVSAGTREVLFNVFEGLVKPDADGNLVGAVAEEWNLVAEGDVQSYVFTIREGVKFHNGAELTVDDVVWSIERAIEMEALESDNVASVAEKDGGVVITLKAPDPDFVSYMTVAILPKDYAEQATAPVGTGPFRFVSRAAQQSIVFERFADYWGEGAKIDKATYQIYENAEALVMALRGGAIDVCAHLTSTQIAQLGADFQILEGTMNLVQAIYLNHEYEPLQNEKVREAMCYALDREAVFALIADGHGTPVGSSMYPNFRKYFLPELADAYPHSVDKAKALLAEAGYANGFDLTIRVPSNYQPHIDTAQIVAEQLRAVGINVTLEPITWGSWLGEVYNERKFEATVVGVDASELTAPAMLSRFVSTAHNNFTNYANEDYDAAYAAALAAADEDERTQHFKRCEEILSETAAHVYIQDLADLVALRTGLAGYEFYPLYVIDLSTIHYE